MDKGGHSWVSQAGPITATARSPYPSYLTQIFKLMTLEFLRSCCWALFIWGTHWRQQKLANPTVYRGVGRGKQQFVVIRACLDDSFYHCVLVGKQQFVVIWAHWDDSLVVYQLCVGRSVYQPDCVLVGYWLWCVLISVLIARYIVWDCHNAQKLPLLRVLVRVHLGQAGVWTNHHHFHR